MARPLCLMAGLMAEHASKDQNHQHGLTNKTANTSLLPGDIITPTSKFQKPSFRLEFPVELVKNLTLAGIQTATTPSRIWVCELLKRVSLEDSCSCLAGLVQSQVQSWKNTTTPIPTNLANMKQQIEHVPNTGWLMLIVHPYIFQVSSPETNRNEFPATSRVFCKWVRSCLSLVGISFEVFPWSF